VPVPRVGGASGSDAKTISAYDKTVSDDIYGAAMRYVSKGAFWTCSTSARRYRWPSQRAGLYPQVDAGAAEPQAVKNTMPAFFDLMREKAHPTVRVVFGHFIFICVHRHMDGNGRVGRFLMNTMMAPGGVLALPATV
jgi:hypothetical protein